MYERINIINAYTFAICNNNLWISKKIDKLYYVGRYDEALYKFKLAKIDGKKFGYELYGDNEYIFISDGKCKTIVGSNINNLKLGHYLFLFLNNDNTFFCRKRWDVDIRAFSDNKIRLLDIDFNLLDYFKVEHNARLLVLFDSHLCLGIRDNHNVFRSFEIINRKTRKKELCFGVDKYYWNIKEEVFKGLIVQVIKIDEKTIFIHLAKYRIIVFNIITKTIMWEIHNFINDTELEKYIAFGVGMGGRTPMEWIYDKKNENLLLFARFYGWCIDLKTRTSNLIFSQDEIPIRERWNIVRPKLYGDNIVFSGYKGIAGFANYIGVFSLITNEVIWSYKTDKGDFKEPPLLNGDYLYGIDTQDKLHVFKKNIDKEKEEKV